MHTCIHVLVTFRSFWKLINIIFNQINLLWVCFYTLSIAKRLVKNINYGNCLGTCILKPSAFTLYWIATCAQSVSSKKYPIYWYTIHLIHHKSSLTGCLISLLGLEWDCTWLFLLLALSNCLQLPFKVCILLPECSPSVFLHGGWKGFKWSCVFDR